MALTPHLTCALKAGLFSRLLARIHRSPAASGEPCRAWRTGVVLRVHGHSALVRMVQSDSDEKVSCEGLDSKVRVCKLLTFPSSHR